MKRLIVWLSIALSATCSLFGQVAQLSYYTGTTGTWVDGGGTSYYCESNYGSVSRYNERWNATDGYYLMNAGSLPLNSWTVCGINPNNTGTQYIYFRFAGGWPYTYDGNKAMIVFKEYIPGQGYVPFHIPGPGNSACTWLLIAVYFNENSGAFAAGIHTYGAGVHPIGFNIDSQNGWVYPKYAQEP